MKLATLSSLLRRALAPVGQGGAEGSPPPTITLLPGDGLGIELGGPR
jgi:hypothetical protein